MARRARRALRGFAQGRPRAAAIMRRMKRLSALLLVVLVAAAYLARAKRRKTPRAVEVVASVEPPQSVLEHAEIGRGSPAAGTGRSGSVLIGGGS